MTMHAWNFETTVRTIVEAMLPRWSGDLGLHFVIEISGAIYANTDDEEDKDVRAKTEFVILRPMHYTRVLVKQWFDPKEIIPFFNRTAEGKKMRFNLASDHDSCWPDGIDRSVKEAQQKIVETLGVDGWHDRSFVAHQSFELFAGQPKYVLTRTLEYNRKNRTVDIEMTQEVPLQDVHEHLPGTFKDSQ